MRFFLLILFFPGVFSAQSNILNDPDIVWAAEIQQDWVVDIPSLDMEWDEGITTLKLLRSEQNEAYWGKPYLQNLVLQAIRAKKLPVYLDPLCQIPQDLYYSKDTIVLFDPKNYEERVWIRGNKYSPSFEFKAWRLRQILVYHKKSASWSTRVEAIAPLIIQGNGNGDSIGLRPLFWFKPSDKRPKLNSNDIVWAKQTRNRLPRNEIPMDSLNRIKVTAGFKNPMVHLIEVMKTNANTPFYHINDDKPMSMEERNDMLTRRDTTFTIDWETLSEEINIINNDLNPFDINKLRLLQTWYWDERLGRLSICLDAVSPIKDVFGENLKFRYSLPLFYRRAKR